MKKHKKLIILLSVIVLIVAAVAIWNGTRITTDDVNVFLDGSYKELYCGNDAKAFFEEYADLSSYKDIAYYFDDDGRLIPPYSLLIGYRLHSVHALDIYYEEELFEKIVDAFEREFGEPDCALNNFAIKKVTKPQDTYTKHTVCFCYDREHYTVRLLLICNAPDYDIYPPQMLKLTPLGWNWSKNSWAFDYSDIVSEDENLAPAA